MAYLLPFSPLAREKGPGDEGNKTGLPDTLLEV